jgi:hypothetical protein
MSTNFPYHFLGTKQSGNKTLIKIKVKVKVKISLLEAVEAPRVARGRGFHITYTNG